MTASPLDLDGNPLRAPGDGGPGFCYLSDADLFRGAGSLEDGPFLIALDSNIILDLEQHGTAILEREEADGINAEHQQELAALGAILDLWMVRDIRFVVVPRTRVDYRKAPSPSRMVERERMFEHIEAALTFQTGDWGREDERFGGARAMPPVAARLIDSVSPLDGRMLTSAWNAGVDVFLTRDARLLAACQDGEPPFPAVLAPTGLVNRLAQLGEDPFFLGQVEHPSCAWAFGMPFGDTGKWVSLYEAMGV
ncbi:hypothetical protein DEA06_08345 [Microbacterium sp. Gd 4-13]|uniref:hypothetical protein n=1 Tax=Microbacterium sp. Gd 4-13 TaxID=2173179 RepID=UPI000D5799E0|nr:hypothetical protein [Microbacterium sp. Gd 4-13]PVW04774.1 hypothetical protein DEA06_08345 [Microbacterium sp. Gd 4-13]